MHILKFAEVEDIITDILNPSKTQIENVDDFGARGQFVKPLINQSINQSINRPITISIGEEVNFETELSLSINKKI